MTTAGAEPRVDHGVSKGDNGRPDPRTVVGGDGAMRILHGPTRELTGGHLHDRTSRRNVAWRSHADLVDCGSCYEVRMTVRGVHPDRLSVEVRDEVLVVSARGTVRSKPESGDHDVLQRLIGLPPDASRMGATARLDGDRLVIRIPRRCVTGESLLDLERTTDGTAEV